MTNQESKIIPLLNFEEGYSEKPYIDSLGFPSAGTGFKLGPKGAPLSYYTFKISKPNSDFLLSSLVNDLATKIIKNTIIAPAYALCNQARKDILLSMDYQMGEGGLDDFKKVMAAIRRGDYDTAAAEMLDSKWARQTPERAKRQAAVMKSGTFAGVYNF